MNFRKQKAQEIQTYLLDLFKKKIFDQFPEIKESVTFGCGDYSRSPYQFYTWVDSFLCVDGVDLYDEEAENKLLYFSYGDKAPTEKDLGYKLQCVIEEEIFDGDFEALFAAWLFLASPFHHEANTLTIYKDGSLFKFQ